MIGSSHEPCTMNGSSNGVAPGFGGVTRAAVPFRSSSRAGIEAEPASAEYHRRAFDLHILDRHHALLDFQRDRHLVKGRAPAAEFAAARQRPPFQPAQQLLDIESRERAVRPGQAGGAVEGLRHREHTVTAPFDGERNIAFAFEPTQTEQLAEAAFKVDIGEIAAAI